MAEWPDLSSTVETTGRTNEGNKEKQKMTLDSYTRTIFLSEEGGVASVWMARICQRKKVVTNNKDSRKEAIDRTRAYLLRKVQRARKVGRRGETWHRGGFCKANDDKQLGSKREAGPDRL